MMRICVLAFITLALSFTNSFAQILSGTASVSEGDTLEISNQTIRLLGIDAPEITQTCVAANGATWECGKISRDQLKAFIGNNQVTCAGQQRNSENQLLARCQTSQIDLNASMVAFGMAWALNEQGGLYIANQTTAQQGRLGIWQAQNQPAWAFRETKKILRAGVTVGGYASNFKQAASQLDIDLDIHQTSCKTGKITTCSYSAGPNLAYIVSGPKESASAESITQIFVNSTNSEADRFTNAADLLLGTGALIAVVDPDLSTTERGSIVKETLLDVVTNAKEKDDPVLKNGITYSAIFSTTIGIWFIAEKRQ